MRLELRILVIALSCVAPVKLAAWVPPKIDVHETLQGGRIAFWARVTSAEFVEDKHLETIGRLHLKVTECFFGKCQGTKRVTLRYRAFIMKEQVETVPFVAVGGEVLVVLGSEEALREDAFISGEGPDRFFFSEPPEIGLALAEMSDGKRRLTLSSRPCQSQEVSMDELRAWSKERSRGR